MDAEDKKEGITLQINQSIVDQLGITQESKLIIAVVDDMIIIKVKNG